MRLVEVLVSDDEREAAVDVLEEHGVDYVRLHADEEEEGVLLSFPLPSGAVDDVLSRLSDAGVETERYATISSLDAAMTEHFDELERKFTEGPEAESRVARGELRASAREIEPDRSVFLLQATLSATVATAGLLLDSAIAIVGSMVISPFTASLLSAALGVLIGERELLKGSLISQTVGLTLAVVTGGVVGAVARWTSLGPSSLVVEGSTQLADFSSPNLLLLTIAVTAGAASAVALATNQGIVLAGVAVAAAVVPSAAAIGVGIAWGHPGVATGAFVLLLLNVVSINLVSLITFLGLGYRPSMFDDSDEELSEGFDESGQPE